MVKGIIATIIAFLIFLGVGIYEQHFITNEFKTFEEILTPLYEKIEDESANEQDGLSVQKWWLHSKKTLHIVIPHNDIKDIDYYLAETISYISTKDYNLAKSKTEVLLELCEHIPGTYKVSIENIF